jgi:hypothetical protein
LDKHYRAVEWASFVADVQARTTAWTGLFSTLWVKAIAVPHRLGEMICHQRMDVRKCGKHSLD